MGLGVLLRCPGIRLRGCFYCRLGLVGGWQFLVGSLVNVEVEVDVEVGRVVLVIVGVTVFVCVVVGVCVLVGADTGVDVFVEVLVAVCRPDAQLIVPPGWFVFGLKKNSMVVSSQGSPSR